MTLNVKAVHDFGTVLHAIPFNTLSIPDFYCSIRSFYAGFLERLVAKYRKNNPFLINITHSFKHFLQMCDFVKPLLEGLGPFTNMLTAIIRDIYHIDLDLNELCQAAHEVKGESIPTEHAGLSSSSMPALAPALSHDEMCDVV